jgi:hypothetical protein
MSFPYVLQRDCRKAECDEDDCSGCAVCPCEPKCLQVEHSVIVACTPSHLAALAEKLPMQVAILEPISYTMEVRITNRFTYPISIQHVYSALAASELWGVRRVRQLPVLDEPCTTRDVDECGDLLALAQCLQPCQTLLLEYSLAAKCESICEGGILGGAACAEICDRIRVYAVNNCDGSGCSTASFFKKTHLMPLPV